MTLSTYVCFVLNSRVNGLNQVYFIGNFANIPQVRYWLTKLMLVKMAMMVS